MILQTKTAMFTLELYFLPSGFGKKIYFPSKILLLLPSCYYFCLLWHVAVPHRGQATVLQCFVEMPGSQKFVFQRSHTQSIVEFYTPKNSWLRLEPETSPFGKGEAFTLTSNLL